MIHFRNFFVDIRDKNELILAASWRFLYYWCLKK
jgi:hypothetical protein